MSRKKNEKKPSEKKDLKPTPKGPVARALEILEEAGYQMVAGPAPQGLEDLN